MTIAVQNVSESKLYHYHSWGNDRTTLLPAWPRLTDNFGNDYPRAAFGPIRFVAGQQITMAPVHPGKSVTDVLVFDPPIDHISFLQLKLPASAVGEKGEVRLHIPWTMIQGEGPKPPKAYLAKKSEAEAKVNAERAERRKRAEAEAEAKNKANRAAHEVEVARLEKEHRERVEQYKAAKVKYDKELAAYEKVKREYDAAKKLQAARPPAGASASLLEVYRQKQRKVIDEYPDTEAAEDAKLAIKAGGYVTPRNLPPEPVRPVAPKEPVLKLPPPPAPVTPDYPPEPEAGGAGTTPAPAAVSASTFVGRWKLVDAKGVPSSYLTVSPSSTAKRDHAPDSPGRWEVVGNEARFTWDDGFRDVMRYENGRMTYHGLGKAGTWDSPPTLTLQATRIP